MFSLFVKMLWVPFALMLVGFAVLVPATKNGETLFWGGIQVWQELSEHTKELFPFEKTKFLFDFDVNSWKLFFGQI